MHLVSWASKAPSLFEFTYVCTLCTDIRDTVKYKEVMKQYGLGPNGGIVTSLNLFATRFDQVVELVKKRLVDHSCAIMDTPGQIEVFTWSASGTIITEMLVSQCTLVQTYVLTYVYVYTYVHAYVPTNMLTYIQTCLRTYKHAYVHTSMFTYVQTDICRYILNMCTYVVYYSIRYQVTWETVYCKPFEWHPQKKRKEYVYR